MQLLILSSDSPIIEGIKEKYSGSTSLYDPAEPVSVADISRYKLIHNCDICVVPNQNKALDPETSLQISYAMIERRPIIMHDVPTFDTAVNPFIKQFILNKLNKFFLLNFTVLEENELSSFIQSVMGAQNYVLTRNQVILIKAQMRAHFRELSSSRSV